jgi:glycerol-3-phosphate acyltransferase PlsY
MYIVSIVLGYLLGSIPFALVIGKVFYNTDVRKHGSGNLGGTNTGRVLGKKAGLAVAVLDVLKVVLAIAITSRFEHANVCSSLAGCAAAIGHCYPLFARFKGGKAVATTFGYLFGISIFTFHDHFIYLLPLIIFLMVLYFTKIVSISSICFGITSSIYVLCTIDTTATIFATILLTILMIYRHRANLERIKNGTENKITWM